MRAKPTHRIDEGRREFLRGRFRAPELSLGPSPPCLPETLASENPCLECDAPCVAACEPGIIRLHPEGHPRAGVPYLSFEKDGCTFCNDCVQRCPLERDDLPLPIRLGRAELDRAACVAWDGVVCVTCRFICTYRAIRVDRRGRPEIDAEACTGCGFCIGPCPTRAIRVSY